MFEVVAVGTCELGDLGTTSDIVVAEFRREVCDPARILSAGFPQLVIEMRDADVNAELAGRPELVQRE